MSRLSYSAQKDPIREKGEPSSSKSPLYQEVELLKKEIESLRIENTKFREENERQSIIIEEINIENIQIMQLYEFRGKLLHGLKEHEFYEINNSPEKKVSFAPKIEDSKQ